MADHLTPDQLDRYVKRALSPRELVAAGEHLAACEPCREQASDPQKLDAFFSFLRDDFETQAKLEPAHLEYEQLEAYVDHDADDAEREIVDSHVEWCRMCGEELRDLQKFRASLESREVASPGRQESLELLTIHGAASGRRMRKFWSSPGYLAGLASAIAFVLVVAWIVPARRHVAKAPSAGQAAGYVPAAAAQQELETPPELAGLIGKPETLLGSAAASSPFALLAPVGTFVEDARPAFRWQALAGATSYKITVFDVALNEVDASPALSGTEWKSTAVLERGKVYLWQVAATRDGEKIVVPAPPAPEAKFEVLDVAHADELEQLKSTQRNAHFALGRAYAKAGVLDEAEREFRLVSSSDADFALAQKFIADLEGLRHPGH